MHTISSIDTNFSALEAGTISQFEPAFFSVRCP